jgi:hypothetical protein
MAEQAASGTGKIRGDRPSKTVRSCNPRLGTRIFYPVQPTLEELDLLAEGLAGQVDVELRR